MSTCVKCKIEFEKSNFKTYCSLQCYNKSNRPHNNSVLLNCEYCGKLVLKFKSNLAKHIFCNSQCSGYYNHGKSLNVIKLQCSNCGTPFTKKISNLFNRETHKIKLHNFCSRTCKGTHDSKVGNGIFNPSNCFRRNRSKLEIFIESKIRFYYPFLELKICDRLQLNGLELDFYFPDLKLAIEINGIAHYKPIYTFEQFEKIQSKDILKTQLCLRNNIHLLVIKSLVRFSKSNSDHIWNNEIFPILSKFVSP